MRVSWASALVDTMCDLKREGLDFDAAWSRAIRLHPVRGVGWREIETEDLFEAAETGDGPVSFMHRACRDAWFNRKPQLRNLRLILDSEGDPSVSEFRWRPQGARSA
jgi:hypothetical protein